MVKIIGYSPKISISKNPSIAYIVGKNKIHWKHSIYKVWQIKQNQHKTQKHQWTKTSELKLRIDKKL